VQRPAALRLKHAADRVGAIAALAVLSPLIGVIAWRIRSEDGGPVFFRQARAGEDGKPFEVWKFRSMVVGADRVGLGLNVAAGDDRITRTGKLLRDWSLDELPQLINVALGEMSLVGPRPGLPDQAARYTEAQRRRLEMRPGLTGWAQVNGRNSLSWNEKFSLDIWYVDHRSVWLDLRIIGLTFLKVFSREGISQEGHATAARFRGNHS